MRKSEKLVSLVSRKNPTKLRFGNIRSRAVRSTPRPITTRRGVMNVLIWMFVNEFYESIYNPTHNMLDLINSTGSKIGIEIGGRDDA
jgi:hypothetical protein